MNLPNPQRYRSEGRSLGVDEITLDNAIATIKRLQASSPSLPAVFTLRHLAHLTQVKYGYLRYIVRRKVNYRHFRISKKLPGRNRYRLISIPPANLSKLQRWISNNILRHLSPSSASYAYHPGSNPRFAAEQHCGCEWLIKIDVQDFFHAISEGRIAEIFYKAGYPRLLSFELARIVTCVLPGTIKRAASYSARWPVISQYQHDREGVLPQGAPTSPMLSNLAMRALDERLIALAAKNGMIYTRYADDLVFSCKNRTKPTIDKVKRSILRELSREGFQPNLRKTAVRGPGSRRIVLGVLVNGKEPRLTRDFKENLRMHFHFLTSEKHGPHNHANNRGTSISGIYHHVRGLIAWAKVIEPAYGANLMVRFHSINWPSLQPHSIFEDMEK
ncbi:reverse transcriptase family protein [Methylobacterium goesingense]|uniref:RNA-directed DNA polymerase n=1 Tax=Methylobacterium goesingense TaxID=243690 RepID=A0ABV2LA38_9HYPH|nr:reverse transcriptase family protein [Methylobacterium goesingense]GJD76520.1 hypothetical protein CFIICLFH_4778 [Methylobacterium goesingense]